MLDRLARWFQRSGDDAASAPIKIFLVKMSLVGVVATLLLLLLFKLVIAPDEDTLAWRVTELNMGVACTLFGFTLIHLYFFGATLSLKVFFCVGCFALITMIAAAGNPCNNWHFAYIVILDIVLLLQSEQDRIVFARLSFLLRAAGAVYISLHVASMAGAGVNIHFLETEYSPISALLNSLVVMSMNFDFVRIFALDARSEAKKVETSVLIASHIAEALANFDLDAANDMIEREDFDSPIREPLEQILRNLQTYRAFLPDYLFAKPMLVGENPVVPPNAALAEEMSGKQPSWEHAKRAVQRLRDPEYSLEEFRTDVEAAFPELGLYTFGTGHSEDRLCTSGRTGEVELQRTMGAMYAVYCIARVDIDGKQIFSFGVDEHGRPLLAPRGDPSQKRQMFYDAMDWDKMLDLFLRADLVKIDPQARSLRGSPTEADSHGQQRTGLPLVHSLSDVGNVPVAHTGNITINSERMLAFLVLTAVHDVMKNSLLLPTVQQRHAPYKGMKEGTEIKDHDLALAYIMETCPSLLPSFQGLEPGQRAPIVFTQGKMGFNNGWLVQGEAPPGPLFSSFKEIILQGRASQSDVSFYFAHWLTDLAGAEAHGRGPWPGSEKFVVRFPLRVLNAFLESFEFTGRLVVSSEVEVMEAYLQSRWSRLGPSEFHVAQDCQLAAMRLALMAQGFEATAVVALQALPPAERRLLGIELARTGLRAQFSSAPIALCSQPAGPALLIYYAPALVQKAGSAHVMDALRILAAVCSAARELFPLESDPLSLRSTVTIRIDLLKELAPAEIVAEKWYLRSTSWTDAEAVRGVPDSATEGRVATLTIPIIRPFGAQQEQGTQNAWKVGRTSEAQAGKTQVVNL